jgi:hypothetical protein
MVSVASDEASGRSMRILQMSFELSPDAARPFVVHSDLQMPRWNWGNIERHDEPKAC